MNALFAHKRNVSTRIAGLLGVSILPNLAFAAQATGPAGLQGLPEALLQLTAYPYIAVALAFLVFKATNKKWAFLLIPFLYWALSFLVPIVDPLGPEPEDAPVSNSSIIAWLYLPHVLATAFAYCVHSRTKKVSIFVLVPVIGWILQCISLMLVLSIG